MPWASSFITEEDFSFQQSDFRGTLGLRPVEHREAKNRQLPMHSTARRHTPTAKISWVRDERAPQVRFWHSVPWHEPTQYPRQLVFEN